MIGGPDTCCHLHEIGQPVAYAEFEHIELEADGKEVDRKVVAIAPLDIGAQNVRATATFAGMAGGVLTEKLPAKRSRCRRPRRRDRSGATRQLRRGRAKALRTRRTSLVRRPRVVAVQTETGLGIHR